MLIVFCLPGREYSGLFLERFSLLLLQCFRRGIQVRISQQYSPSVYQARIKCLGGDPQGGPSQPVFHGKYDYDYMMWIDSDIIFDPKDFFALLESPHDVTCGLYLRTSLDEYAAAVSCDEGEQLGPTWITDAFMQKHHAQLGSRYLPVAYAGMGWMLLRKGVVESIAYPWFYEPLRNITTASGNSMIEIVGEDTAFCNNLREKGYTVMVDTTLRVGHLKPHVI